MALPILCARQSHAGDSALDSADANAKDCDNRASWYCSVGIATPSYQEAPLLCPDHRGITRTGTLFG